MKKLVIILIFILLLVFILQLHSARPYGKERVKGAKPGTKDAAPGHFLNEKGFTWTTDEDLWHPPQATAHFPTIAIFQVGGKY